jgi:hypothetical protein
MTHEIAEYRMHPFRRLERSSSVDVVVHLKFYGHRHSITASFEPGSNLPRHLLKKSINLER